MIQKKKARYIKLGEQGIWEDLCLNDGTLRLGYYEVPHELALEKSKEEICDVYVQLGTEKGAANNHARQVLDFYDTDPDMVWVTFSRGCLWWCEALPGMEYQGSNKEEFPQGSRIRKTINGWSNTDINGEVLRISDLSGHLTKVAAYRATICDIKGQALEYLLRKINGEKLPEVENAITARKSMQAALEQVIKLLTWQDFELFIDLIFSQSGWHRVSAIGGAQKTVDLELVQPLTQEKAIVQVKSQTDQAQFNEYVHSLGAYEADKLFYVYHSAQNPINPADTNITVMDVSELAKVAMRSGLSEWLINKVG